MTPDLHKNFCRGEDKEKNLKAQVYSNLLFAIYVSLSRNVETWIRLRRVPVGAQLAGGEDWHAGDGAGAGRGDLGQADGRHQDGG